MTIPETSAFGLSKQPSSGRLPPRISGRHPSAPPQPQKVKLPQILSYPKPHSINLCERHLKDHLCYYIRHYGDQGLSVLIVRDPKSDKVTVLCGDWYGHNIDLVDDSSNRIVQSALVFLQEDLKLFLQIMSSIKLLQAQFFFALGDDNRLMLTDIQISLNKLAGPGMVRDIFGRVYKTQEVIKIEICDDRALEYLAKGTGSYEGDLIIKPSRFTTFSPTNETEIVPLYAEVRR